MYIKETSDLQTAAEKACIYKHILHRFMEPGYSWIGQRLASHWYRQARKELRKITHAARIAHGTKYVIHERANGIRQVKADLSNDKSFTSYFAEDAVAYLKTLDDSMSYSEICSNQFTLFM